MRYTRPGKFSTIHKVDLFLLELELTARGLRCEVPDCSGQAITFYGDEMPAFICCTHMELRDSGMRHRVKSLISSHMDRIVIESANRAWAGSDDEVVIEYNPGNMLQRYIEMPVMEPQVILTTDPVKARPPLPALPDANTELTSLEFFPLF